MITLKVARDERTLGERSMSMLESGPTLADPISPLTLLRKGAHDGWRGEGSKLGHRIINLCQPLNRVEDDKEQLSAPRFCPGKSVEAAINH